MFYMRSSLLLVIWFGPHNFWFYCKILPGQRIEEIDLENKQFIQYTDYAVHLTYLKSNVLNHSF